METTIYSTLRDGSRVSFGAEEFVFVQVSEEMSLAAALRIQAITHRLTELSPLGIIDVCPSNTSYMVRQDPDEVDPRSLLPLLEELHEAYPDANSVILETEIIEIPIFYNDPWTTETLMRFRKRHQSESETDIEYCTRINGFSAVADFVSAHSGSPFIVTFPCFVPGNAECMQLVPRERQIQAPKYLSPRTDTPARALGHGGAFSTVYPAAGVGGYQLIGRSPVPVVDMKQEMPGFETSIVLARPSTIFKYTPIEQEEYFSIRASVESHTYQFRRSPVQFNLSRYLEAPDFYGAQLIGELP
jgi:urea carboxylase